MVQLGVYEDQPVIIRTHGCNESVPGAEAPSPSEAGLCRKFVDGFLRPLQGGSASAKAGVVTLAQLRQQHEATRYVCFRRLLAGGYHEMFNAAAHPGKEPLIALYRHRVLAFHGLVPMRAPSVPITEHTVLLVRKQGRRGIHNFDQVPSLSRHDANAMRAA